MCLNRLTHRQQNAAPSSLVREGLVLSSLTCTCRDPPLACSPGERREKPEWTKHGWVDEDDVDETRISSCAYSPSAPLGFYPQYQYRLHPPSSRFLDPNRVPEREPERTDYVKKKTPNMAQGNIMINYLDLHVHSFSFHNHIHLYIGTLSQKFTPKTWQTCSDHYNLELHFRDVQCQVCAMSRSWSRSCLSYTRSAGRKDK